MYCVRRGQFHVKRYRVISKTREKVNRMLDQEKKNKNKNQKASNKRVGQIVPGQQAGE